MMLGFRVSSPLSAVVGSLVFLVATTASVQAASAMPSDARAGLVRYALATEHLAPVLPFADSLEGESARFLRARLLFDSGKVQQGVDELKEVTQGHYHRAEASLILGRQMLLQGHPEKANPWFQLAAETGSGDVRQQALYELAELARAHGQFDRAGQILAGMKEGYWAAVGYLNLSTDYAQKEGSSARALVSIRVALAMAEKDSASDRRAQLTSRLLVRAGYLAFKQGDYDKAIRFLKKVPLDSYSTPEALYFHGLALAESGNHRAAMQSWHRAKKYPLAYRGVADAWIGMGRGYDLSGYLGQAGEAYLAAHSAYEGERVTLRKLAEKIKKEGAYKALVTDARQADVEWFLADSRTLAQPRMAYLLEFIKGPQAQAAVSRVAELRGIEQQLAWQIEDLTVFIDAIDDQLKSLSQQSHQATSAFGPHQRQKALQKNLEQLEAVVTTSRQKKQLASISETLIATANRLNNLADRVAVRPATLRNKREKARELRSESDEYLMVTNRLVDRAEDGLDKLALAFVAEQDRRMAFALDKTEQQIAHLYEYLALKNLEEGKP